MRLVFYSGGTPSENRHLDKKLLDLCGKKSPKMVYIPYSSYESEVYFKEFVGQYKRFGINRFINFPIDIPMGPILKREVFNSDIIHLSGGNTYYFLKSLRISNLTNDFKRFVNRGGILTGLSAGAILMTPNIETAGFPHFDCDENEENVKDLRSMGLVKFYFYPHYKNSKRYDSELLKYSKSAKYPLYACPDGSGIIAGKNELSFVGRSYAFIDGQKMKIK